MGLFSRKKTTVGHRYFLGFHKILCHGPIDKLLMIRAGEEVLWRRTSTSQLDDNEQLIYIDKPNVFGGEDKAGGIQGYVNMQFGAMTQAADSYLRSRLGVNIPAFRGVVGAVLRQPYIGTSNYPKTWDFLLSRIHRTGQYGESQWYPEKAAVQGDLSESSELDMNGAHIIRESLTNSEWGLGVDTSEIDNDSFTLVADTLHSENFGLSIYWDQEKEISDFIQLVLDHIGGVLYVHPATGRYNLRLIRPDYNQQELPHLTTNSDIEKIQEFNETSIGDRVSQVTVSYWDRVNLTVNSITVSDPALAIEQSSRVSTTFDYRGISNARIAAQVAQRELDAASRPLKAMKLICNTMQTSGFSIGDAIRVTLPRPGVIDHVVRITAIDYGTLEDNKITIECVTDIFQDNVSAVGSGSSEWSPPSVDPSAPTVNIFQESNYLDIAYFGAVSDAELVRAGTGRLFYTFIRSEGITESGNLWTRIGSAIQPSPTNYQFIEEALSYADVFHTAGESLPTRTEFSLSGTVDTSGLRSGDLMFLNGLTLNNDEVLEKVSFVNYNSETNSMTILRGVGDCIPYRLQAGALILNYSDAALDDFNRPIDQTVSGYFLSNGPTTAIEHEDVNTSSVAEVSITGRSPKPYIQGNINVNGHPIWDTELGEVSTIEASWYHRCKQDQQAVAYSYFDPAAASRPDSRDGYYRVRILDDNSELIYEMLTKDTAVTIPNVGIYTGPGEFDLVIDSIAYAEELLLSSHCKAKYHFTVDFSGAPQYNFSSNIEDPAEMGVNNHIAVGDYTVGSGDNFEMTMVISDTVPFEASPYDSPLGRLRFLPNGTIIWDGASRVFIDNIQITTGSQYPTDGEPHLLRCELDLESSTAFRFIGCAEQGQYPFQGILREFKWFKDDGLGGETLHRYWPIDDGWPENPTIREVEVSENGVMVNGVKAGWTYYAN